MTGVYCDGNPPLKKNVHEPPGTPLKLATPPEKDLRKRYPPPPQTNSTPLAWLASGNRTITLPRPAPGGGLGGRGAAEVVGAGARVPELDRTGGGGFTGGPPVSRTSADGFDLGTVLSATAGTSEPVFGSSEEKELNNSTTPQSSTHKPTRMAQTRLDSTRCSSRF